MSATIIPEQRFPFKGKGAYAEQETFDFLKFLPSGYFILRECKINPATLKRLRGSDKRQPDFVVIGPSIGIVILEVKDWNIIKNRYGPLNQFEVPMLAPDGSTTILDNPMNQADEYQNAVREELSGHQNANPLWVSSFVVYPRLYRTDFENRCVGIQKNNPQQKYIFDLERVLFRDDLDSFRGHPLDLIEKYVAKFYRRSISQYTEQQVKFVVYHLVPSEMRIGGTTQDTKFDKDFAILDKEQQEWAFSESLGGKTHLVDVAGSGKTNVLLSRAIYKAKQHLAQGGCNILVLTYSKALLLELERIFHDKIADDPQYDYLSRSIKLFDMISLMEEVVKKGMGDDISFESWRRQNLEKHSLSKYIDEVLPERCIDILRDYRKLFQVYDYLFIDEVQDFSTWFFAVAVDLLKDWNNIFTVGDIGQRLFDRELDWSEFDIVKQRAELERRFLMYRSPQPVAKLAWKFLISDRFIEADLRDEGYQMNIKPKSPFMYKPVLIKAFTEEALLQEVVDDIQSHLLMAERRQFMCIGLKGKLLSKLYQALNAAFVPVRWATEVNPIAGDYVVLADYVEAKGLEREYVYIIDADNLAEKGGPFATEEQVTKELRRDRIKLFVALTRAMREVRLYYMDSYHTFIRQLLEIESKL